MNFLKYTDFRNKSKEYLDKVENGDSFIIIRKGKPVARIIPFHQEIQGWKREHAKITLKGKKDSLEYIQQERNEG